ncbi:hypothetical protein JJE64_08700 [Alloprevotella tannerae]|uniref:hypothetical protein n=1 Tax=Alloprevotella tannerae TaxID=76122 RepID=UPI001EDAD557|nr:hypothetical protein [Alloprevotella tannerae]MCG2651471.1 hypothetical protein [Alloprevotella tannerae]
MPVEVSQTSIKEGWELELTGAIKSRQEGAKNLHRQKDNKHASGNNKTPSDYSPFRPFSDIKHHKDSQDCLRLPTRGGRNGLQDLGSAEKWDETSKISHYLFVVYKTNLYFAPRTLVRASRKHINHINK